MKECLPRHWPIDDPMVLLLFSRLAEGVSLSEATIRKMEDVGGVALSEIKRSQLQIAVRTHAADVRFVVPNRLDAKTASILREAEKIQKARCKKIANLASSLAQELRNELELSGPFSLGTLSLSLRMINSCKKSMLSIPAYAEALDELAAAARYKPRSGIKRAPGRPTCDWDGLLKILAKIYSEAGGKASVARSVCGYYETPFMKFVDALREGLPLDVRGATLQTLGDRARKKKLVSGQNPRKSARSAG